MSYSIFKPSIYLNDILSLKQQSDINPLNRSRICLHEFNSLEIQQMIINIKKSSYIPPHRQLKCKKSYMILDGSLILYFFNNTGKLEEVVHMDNNKKNNPFMLMFDAGRWHTVKSESNYSTYLETRNSYSLTDTEFSTWAPDKLKLIEGLAYINDLTKERDLQL